MFGVSRPSASRVREATQAEVRVRNAKIARLARRASSGRVPLDVCSQDRWLAWIETKSAETDPYAIQQAVCQQFHWLFARQILFRRREMR